MSTAQLTEPPGCPWIQVLQPKETATAQMKVNRIKVFTVEETQLWVCLSRGLGTRNIFCAPPHPTDHLGRGPRTQKQSPRAGRRGAVAAWGAHREWWPHGSRGVHASPPHSVALGSFSVQPCIPGVGGLLGLLHLGTRRRSWNENYRLRGPALLSQSPTN